MNVRVTSDLSPAQVAAWRQLPGDVFHGPEWNLAFRDVFRPRRVRFLVLSEGAELVGVVAIRIEAGRARALAAGVSDDLSVAATDWEAIVDALGPEALVWEAERRGPGPNALVRRVISLQAFPTPEDFFRTLSKSLRQDLRRPAEIRPGTLDELFGLHAQRWRRRGLPGGFTARRQAFHRRFLEIAPDQGELLTAFQDGRPVATLYALTRGGTTVYYQAGLDVNAKGSPGTQLIAEAIRRAHARGDHTFDFGRGGEPYKARWTGQTVETHLVRVPLRRGGEVLAGALAAPAPLEKWIRATLEERWSRPRG